MPTSQPEAFSRILIDNALEAARWNLLDPKQVRFELDGRDGRACFIKDDLGQIL